MPDKTLAWDYDGMPPADPTFVGTSLPQWSDTHAPIRYAGIVINITDNTITDTYYLPCLDVLRITVRAHIDTGTLSVVRADTLEAVFTQEDLKNLNANAWYADQAALTWDNSHPFNRGFSHKQDPDYVTGMRLKVSTTTTSCTGRLFIWQWRATARVVP